MGLESRTHSIVIKNRTSIFMFSIFLVHILYLAVFLGVVYIDESYIRNLSTIIQTFVAIFLAIRFNPFNMNDRITDFDKQVIFYLATFLLLNVVATEVYVAFIEKTPLDHVVKTAQTTVNSIVKPMAGFMGSQGGPKGTK